MFIEHLLRFIKYLLYYKLYSAFSSHLYFTGDITEA